MQARLGTTLIAIIASTALLLSMAAGASAATQLKGSKQTATVKTLAKFKQPKVLSLKPSGSSARMIYLGMKIKLDRVAAFRSSVDRDFTRVDLVSIGQHFHYTALLERRSGGTKLRYWGQRADFAEAICKRRAPGVEVVHDLGLGPVSDGAYGVRRCRFDRSLSKLRTEMSAQEIAGIRAMYEPQPYTIATPDGGSESGWKSPQDPDFKEPSADCAWNGSPEVDPPAGVVSRVDPRYGLLDIRCVTGSVSGVAALNSTQILVSRPGRSGAFTRMHAHVIPTWSAHAWECLKDHKWPVPARVRVALDFCVPFPGTALVDLNR